MKNSRRITGTLVVAGLVALVGCRAPNGDAAASVADEQKKLVMVQPDDANGVEQARRVAETGERPAPVAQITSTTTSAPEPALVADPPAPAPVVVRIAAPSANYVADFNKFNHRTERVLAYLHRSFQPGQAGFRVVLSPSFWCEVVFGRTLTPQDFDGTLTRNTDQERAFNMLAAINRARVKGSKAAYVVGDVDPRFYSRSPQTRGRRFSSMTLLLSHANGVQSILFSPRHNETVKNGNDPMGFPTIGKWLGNVTISGGNLVTFQDRSGQQVAAVNLSRFAGRLAADGRSLSFNWIDGAGNWGSLGMATLDPVVDRMNRTLTYEAGVDFSSGPLVVRPRPRGDQTHQLNILLRAVEAVPHQVAVYASSSRRSPKSAKPTKKGETPAKPVKKGEAPAKPVKKGEDPDAPPAKPAERGPLKKGAKDDGKKTERGPLKKGAKPEPA